MSRRLLQFAANAALIISLLGLAPVSRAQSTLGFDIDTNVDAVAFPDATFGYSFTTAAPIKITHLCVLDRGGDGLFSNHPVALWQADGTPIVSALVAAGPSTLSFKGSSPLDIWRIVDIPDVIVPAGTYRIGAWYTAWDFHGFSDTPRLFGNVTSAAGITFGANYFEYNGTLTFPTTHAAPNYDPGFFGPSFLFTTNLANVNQAPSLTVPSSVVGVALQQINFTASASDPDGDPITYGMIAGPSGVNVNPTTGAISWTPPAAGTYLITIQADDGNGGTDTKTVTVTVNPVKTAVFHQINLILTRSGSVVTASFDIQNTSTAVASSVRVQSATLGSTSAGSLPGPFTIPAGGSQHMSVSFTGVPPGSATLSIQLAYDGCTVPFIRSVTVP